MTNTPTHTVYGRGKKLRKPKIRKQSEENKINSIRNPFILKKEKNKLQHFLKKKKIIRD